MSNNSICFYALIFNILRTFAPDIVNISYREMFTMSGEKEPNDSPAEGLANIGFR